MKRQWQKWNQPPKLGDKRKSNIIHNILVEQHQSSPGIGCLFITEDQNTVEVYLRHNNWIETLEDLYKLEWFTIVNYGEPKILTTSEVKEFLAMLKLGLKSQD
jgi:hypothetical protein